ncbi:hypothetical protein ZIOFF_004323 [Zingiber officinale]|uniref:Proteasome component Ecm29 N-terminal domain-containing protein n=1 Tax=Zingiber officinale TaxID=94328 RepID=A0A8J5IER8_ZINOF|nr:hypothetical protein ZIOFF_004323 [Zingiber officinale]
MADTSTSSSTAPSDAEREEMLDRMLTRLALADDDKLEPLLVRILPYSISSLASPSPSIRKSLEISGAEGRDDAAWRWWQRTGQRRVVPLALERADSCNKSRRRQLPREEEGVVREPNGSVVVREKKREGAADEVETTREEIGERGVSCEASGGVVSRPPARWRQTGGGGGGLGP